MTATQSARIQARYRGVVYGIDLLDHESVMAGTPRIVLNDYVGKTRQKGRLRENQHRDNQMFSDLIVGSPRVLWEGDCTEDELDEIERHFIQDVEQRPRMNWKMNEDNPEQIPKWVQLEQRHQRDDREGRPRWVPPDQRRAESLLEWGNAAPGRRVSERRESITVRWKPWQIKLGLWSASWAMIATAITAGLAYNNLLETWQDRTLCGSIVALLLIVWVRAGAPITRRQRRRVRGRIRRRGWKAWKRW